MKAEQALELSDHALANLWSTWSDVFYAAGFLVWEYGYLEEFLKWLLTYELPLETAPLEDYEIETVAKIREKLSETRTS